MYVEIHIYVNIIDFRHIMIQKTDSKKIVDLNAYQVMFAIKIIVAFFIRLIVAIFI